MRRRDNINWDSGKVEEIDPETENDNLSDEAFMALLKKKMFEDDYSTEDEDENDDDDDNSIGQNKKPILNRGVKSNLSKEDIGTLQKLTQSNSCCNSIEIILLFCVIFLSVFSFSMIPGFIQIDIYDNITVKEQPICAPIDKEVPGLSKYTIPLVISLLAFFIIKSKNTDLLVVMFSSLILAFDTNFTGLMSQSASTGLMAFLIMMSYNIEHNILSTKKVYNFSWFFNLTLAWFFAAFLPFFRPETIGSIIAIYICFFISGISEVCAVFGNKLSMFFQTVKLIFINYLIGIPVLLFILYMRNKFHAIEYQKMKFHYIFYKYEYYHHNESLYLYVYIALCFLFIFNAKYTYKSIVPLIQSIGGVLGTLFIPYESPGNTYATKLFFVKLHLMIGATIIIGNVKSRLIRYLIPAIFFIISGFYKMKDIISTALED